MSEEKNQEKAPVPAPATQKTAAGPKTWRYIGPAQGPVISNLPGTGQRYRADELPQQYVQFVIDTVPQAKYWWE